MEWMGAISKAIEYIEEHITNDISIADIAKQVNVSPFYFQKGFSLLCGYIISEYIRKRRLALAGIELISTNAKVIDVALKYGYDSPDSFAKAFTRFHGITPVMVRKEGTTLKAFAPLKIKLSLKGGYLMDYKIMQKESFTVMGVSKTFKYENAHKEVPEFWKECFAGGNGKYACGMYGINHDATMSGDIFDYMIADNYNPVSDLPEGFTTEVIPAYTWAVFPCEGAMPKSLQDVNSKIFSEWLPSCNEYEIEDGYCIEMYDDPQKYDGGTNDDNYYSEIWIPVKKKV